MEQIKENITFDDVLIKPKFSNITSRKDVSLTTTIGNLSLDIPIVSANMDTVTNEDLAKKLYESGGISILHRFSSIEKNVKLFKSLKNQNVKSIVSIGLNDYELERAEALIESGANILCIDVAHGAQMSVVEQYNRIMNKYKSNVDIIVGNFATGDTVKEFKDLCVSEPLAFKVGIGGGSACLTRVQTGCGVPQLSAIFDCVKSNPTSNIISDGGHKKPGDIAKALAAGAKMVMLGYMLAGTDEAPGEIINDNYKKYRGSASQEAYNDQGKIADWRTFEGDSFLIPYKGPLNKVLQDITGGIRSSLSYVGARNLEEFREKVEFIRVSNSTFMENTSHGKL